MGNVTFKEVNKAFRDLRVLYILGSNLKSFKDYEREIIKIDIKELKEDFNEFVRKLLYDTPLAGCSFEVEGYGYDTVQAVFNARYKDKYKIYFQMDLNRDEDTGEVYDISFGIGSNITDDGEEVYIESCIKDDFDTNLAKVSQVITSIYNKFAKAWEKDSLKYLKNKKYKGLSITYMEEGF